MVKHQSLHPDLTHQLRTVQRMLGLSAVPTTGASLSEPVFVCIDCEAFEHIQSKVTEIGIAVIDTRDIAGIEAGTDGQQWIEKIQYAHYRPVQYAKLKNKSFIKGCEESFNFGTTSWINLSDAKAILTSIFRHPSLLPQASNLSTRLSGPTRNVVFVAHDASNDNAYMKQLGFSLSTDTDVSLTIDTQRLAGGTKKKPVGLHRLLLSLGVKPINLHNAGNDAAYTLRAMIHIAVKDYAAPGIVAAELQKHQGKLPPLKYNPIVAPQVWVGTAVQPDEGATLNVNSAPGVAASAKTRSERKEHKRFVRAAGNAQGLAVAGTASAQKPLP